MTSLKTKNICFLAAFLFLAIVPTLAKVVDDVQKSNHASTLDDQSSTFTLTNAVPQHQNFNRGRWSHMEGNIKKEMDTHIKDKKNRCFVVVGAKPGNTNLNDKNKPNNKPNNIANNKPNNIANNKHNKPNNIANNKHNNKPNNKPNNIANNKPNDRVNIPSMMWSAFRCTSGEPGAYWDENIELNHAPPMERKTVQQLQDELGKTLQGITVFPQKQPGQKRSSSDSQQPQAGPSKKSRKSRSPSSSAGRS
ncbi:hypothetical protein D5F01_LYC22747 [Larimichthys crocea]|uniref:DNA/RNA non-specific endonuclease/pyrophosphatase/phosphodiesterase domain-containing protein n=1 Tax=Larimichthys crocea TaxID=215358 RepID=A0A6G0HJF4_LARCR|nr:hypothetical protein D5F01_LYC22747 [Larimichthys crocea]